MPLNLRYIVRNIACDGSQMMEIPSAHAMQRMCGASGKWFWTVDTDPNLNCCIHPEDEAIMKVGSSKPQTSFDPDHMDQGDAISKGVQASEQAAGLGSGPGEAQLPVTEAPQPAKQQVPRKRYEFSLKQGERVLHSSTFMAANPAEVARYLRRSASNIAMLDE
jgi:hypothetical protein